MSHICPNCNQDSYFVFDSTTYDNICTNCGAVNRDNCILYDMSFNEIAKTVSEDPNYGLIRYKRGYVRSKNILKLYSKKIEDEELLGILLYMTEYLLDRFKHLKIRKKFFYVNYLVPKLLEILRNSGKIDSPTYIHYTQGIKPIDKRTKKSNDKLFEEICEDIQLLLPTKFVSL